MSLILGIFPGVTLTEIPNISQLSLFHQRNFLNLIWLWEDAPMGQLVFIRLSLLACSQVSLHSTSTHFESSLST